MPDDGDGDNASALIAQARAGDMVALEQLLLLHHDRLASWLAGRLPAAVRPSVSVEDLIQETYIRAFQRIGQLDAAKPPIRGGRRSTQHHIQRAYRRRCGLTGGKASVSRRGTSRAGFR